MTGLLIGAKRLIHHIAYSGLAPLCGIEVRRKVFIVNLFSVVGLAFLAIFSLSALYNTEYLLALLVFTSAVLALGNFFYLRHTGNYRRAGHVVAGIVTALFLFLVCTGGVENTGPLWCYVAAPLILFLYGSHIGLVWIGLLILFAIIVLFVPDMPLLRTDYSLDFKFRFVASFIAVVIMSLVHEYAREESYQRMLEVQREVDRDARTDHLTGLANRRHMFESIERVRADAEMRNCTFSFLLCDLDYFKSLNDTYGHHYGDDVLVAVAKVFAESLRGEDVIARWGGEEFLILLPCTDGHVAQALAEKLRGRVQAMGLRKGTESVAITISIGVHEFDPAQSVDQNIVRADHNLYLAKQRGRNRVVGCT